MQFKQTSLRLFFLLIPFAAISQTTYLPQDARENILIERLEIKGQKDSFLNFSKLKPYSRKTVIPLIESNAGRLDGTIAADPVYDSNNISSVKKLSSVDLYNARMALINSSEWTSQKFASKKPFLKSFYKSPANLFEVNTKDFFLAVNPVVLKSL